jgi:pyocin large subunit-like protein
VGIIETLMTFARTGGQGWRGFALGSWLEHFEKHAAEFGYRTSVEYLRGAQSLTAGGEDVQTFARANGDVLFYNAVMNEFAVLGPEGVIRTYFRPVQGSEYWLRQTGRL